MTTTSAKNLDTVAPTVSLPSMLAKPVPQTISDSVASPSRKLKSIGSISTSKISQNVMVVINIGGNTNSDFHSLANRVMRTGDD